MRGELEEIFLSVALLSPVFSFFLFPSYFALMSLHKNLNDPRTIHSGRKVCVGGGGGGGLKVNLVLALVQNQDVGFGFGLGPS